MLCVVISYEAQTPSGVPSMDVSVRTLLIFWGSEDLMALSHSDVFNKYCQRVPLMSHF